jgi:hypothetical protein
VSIPEQAQSPIVVRASAPNLALSDSRRSSSTSLPSLTNLPHGAFFGLTNPILSASPGLVFTPAAWVSWSTAALLLFLLAGGFGSRRLNPALVRRSRA